MNGALLTASLCLLWASMVSCNRLVCYYNSEAATRGPGGQLLPANIDPNLCTHIIFGFASVDNTKELVPTQASDTTLYTALNSLKSSNAQLKTLLAVGGPGFDSQKFHSMVASSNSRSRFIASAISLLQTYNFDGLNLDWRYPGDATKQDKNRFVSLCQELRTAFNAASPRLLLSASVSAEKTMIVNSYPTPVALANALDFINVLTFGFHDPSSAVTAHHSPLGALSSNAADTKTTEYAMNYWASDLGVPAAKLNMGIAAYGVAFNLTDPSVSGPGAATSGPAEEGCFGGPPGIWSNYEICLYTDGATGQWIADQSVPYAVEEGQWVGFDNTASIDDKVTHITTKGYGGAVVWSLDLDDFTGRFCKDGNNPFISHLKDQLDAASTPNAGSVCSGGSGRFPNPADETTFYSCDHGTAMLQSCPPGLVFRTSCTCCNFP
ncbi:unnamed protein product [Knipowitschia caucasica]